MPDSPVPITDLADPVRSRPMPWTAYCGYSQRGVFEKQDGG
jgi:hypothetical protein